MEALLAIVLFSGSLTLLAVIYRAAEKRSGDRTSGSQSSKLLADRERSTIAPPPAETAATPPSSPIEDTPTAPAAIAPEVPTTTPEPASAIDAPLPITPPTIPDPWLTDAEVAAAPEPPLTVSAPAMVGVSGPSPFGGMGDGMELSGKIDRMGESRQMQQVANLYRYANHPDSKVRASVATALGKLAANQPGKSVEGMIPVLGKLSQDRSAEVRLAAVQALGNVRSPKVLPWLQQAQKTATGEVGKAITIALQNLKLVYQPKPKNPVNPVVSKAKGKRG